MNCDQIWIGKDIEIGCLAPNRCKDEGCLWRKFHKLAPDQFTKRDVASVYIEAEAEQCEMEL